MSYTLPPLPYASNALEPHIDTQTMEIHHGKHHAAYVTNLNNALAAHAPWQNKPILEILQNIQKMPEAIQTAVRNNGGGHWNHSFFWELLTPKGTGKPIGKVAEAINKKFGSFDQFKTEFAQAATTRFGSGWAWLIIRGGELHVCSTPNQDNPLMDLVEVKGTPILGLDVWEHAYYLKYQNRRPDYIQAFWNLVNWEKVEELYK